MDGYTIISGIDYDENGNIYYVASHPELPGCVAHGSSLEEAEESLDMIREMHLAALIENGHTPPVNQEQEPKEQ